MKQLSKLIIFPFQNDFAYTYTRIRLQINGNVVRSVQNKEDLYGRVEPQPMHMVIENGILFVGKGGVGDASTTFMATRLPIPDVVEQLERGTGYE